MRSTARYLSPILVVAMLLSAVAVLAPPGVGRVLALANSTPTTGPVTVTLDDTSPTICWSYNDVDGDPQVNYEVEVWTGMGPGDILVWNPQQAAGEDECVVYDGDPLNPDQTYWASVRASDGVAGWGDWSHVSFCWPQIWPSPGEFWAELLTGQTFETILTIWNDGCEPLVFQLDNSEAWLSLGAEGGTVEPQDYVEVPVVMDSSGLAGGPYCGAEPYYDEIVITSDDPNDSPVVVPVYLDVYARVCPQYVDDVLYPGQSFEVDKTLWFDRWPEVDVFYVVDDTESFADNLDAFRDKVSSIVYDIEEVFPDSRFGLAAFRDFPEAPWGSPGDFAFQILADLTDAAAFSDALWDLTGEGAGDELESQYEALYQVATSDDISWGVGAHKAVVLVTNSGFHTPDDSDGTYPGERSAEEAIAALIDAGITVFAPTINNVEEVVEVAAGTGGLVWLPATPSGDVAQMILCHVGTLSYSTTDGAYDDWLDVSCQEFYYDYDWWDVNAVDFTETITVPVGTPEGVYSFEVQYYICGNYIDEQFVTIEVPPSVEPLSIETEIFAGDCCEFYKSVYVPAFPVEGVGAVDVFLLEDETGSFSDDIGHLQDMAPDIFDAVREFIPDSRFGVGGFRDFPFDLWGDSSTPDWAYRLLQDLTFDRDAFVTAVNSLTAGGGNDGPESQYEALYQAATGAGVDLNSDGDYSDFGEVHPGLNPSFRPDALKVVIMATDADFHNCWDLGSEFGDYPGPCRDDVVAALNAEGIVVVGIEPYEIPQLHDVAEATGGLVEPVASSGEGIAEAILSGLSAVIGWDMVEPVAVDEDPLLVSFDPEAYYHVEGGTWLSFMETICVPEETPDGVYEFTVEFWAYHGDESELIAVQEVSITVFNEFDWIVMVYMAADNDLGEENCWSCAEEVLGAIDEAQCYGPVRPVVLYDGLDSYDSYYDGMGDSQILEKRCCGLRPVYDEGAVIPLKTGEVNMGDPDTLTDFINWVKANYPSQNYALILWDHGKGWRSCNFLQDWTDDDSMTLRELGEALSGATSGGEDPLQLIGFDACLMQMLEVDHQIWPYAQYAVGSEEIEPWCGWPYYDILSELSGYRFEAAEAAFVLELETNWPDELAAAQAAYIDELDTNWPAAYEAAQAAAEAAAKAASAAELEANWPAAYEAAVAASNAELEANHPLALAAAQAAAEAAGAAAFEAELTSGCWPGAAAAAGAAYQAVLDRGGTVAQAEAAALAELETNWPAAYAAAQAAGEAAAKAASAAELETNWPAAYEAAVAASTAELATNWPAALAAAQAAAEAAGATAFNAELETNHPDAFWAAGAALVAELAANYPLALEAAQAAYDAALAVGASVMPPDELGITICDAYEQAYRDDWCEGFPCYTLSVKDLSLIPPLVSAVDDFAAALMDGIGTYDQEIATARAQTQTFGYCDCWYDDHGEMDGWGSTVGSIDLYHFASLISDTLAGTSLGTAAEAVMSAVQDAVIYNVAGELRRNANGIAIYYPDVETMYDYYYDGYDGALDGDGGPWGPQMVVYEPCYDEQADFATDTAWAEYLKLAPRLVQEGCLILYIPDVLILAHVNADPIIRLEWPDITPDVPDFTLAKPVDIIVTPEGAIDMGMVALPYSQADLNAAGILKTQLIGVAQTDGEQWMLEKLTMDLPSWLFDMGPMLDGVLGGLGAAMGEDGLEELSAAFESLSDLCGSCFDTCGPCVDYVGAVIAVPWLDLSSMMPCLYDCIPNLPAVKSDVVTSLAMIATNNEAYLTPIQYPQNLYQGWNAVSLPVIPLDGDVATVLSGHGGVVEGVTEDVEVIWHYDAATGEWYAYGPAAPEASELTELEDGVGYWFNMAGDATMTVVGSNMLAGPNAPPEYELVEGWNFIGYKGILPMPPQDEVYWEEYYDPYWDEWWYDEWYIGGYIEKDKVEYNRLQGYNRVTDALYTPDFMYPNDGYWIYVVEPGSIPGLNDENWIEALDFWAGEEWIDATAEWICYWMTHDGDLGLRLAWNALWYAGWVIAPSEMNYWSDFYWY